jgi:hypothetical protein
MTDETVPTQAMPEHGTANDKPRPTQPTDKRRAPKPLAEDEGFGGFMGHGGQTDIVDQTPKDSGNPNATAQSD